MYSLILLLACQNVEKPSLIEEDIREEINPLNADNDGDGILAADDCDDNDAMNQLTITEDPECDGFYLGANGVTVFCSDVSVGDSGYVDGDLYLKIDESSLESSETRSLVCTSGIKDMSYTFYDVDSLTVNIESWDTSSVINMSAMFYHAHTFNQNIGNWDTSAVTDVSEMFAWTNDFNQNIGNWNTSNIIDMERMFLSTQSFNQDLSGWCVENISFQPNDFSLEAEAWTLPQPIWGTCTE